MFKFKFQINLQSDLKQLTHLKLFNGYNELIFDEYGEMEVSLEIGIYFLWIEINEHVEERKYRIDKDIFDQIDSISSSSSMTLKGMASTHEYFSNAVKSWSEQVTNTQKQQQGGHLFLFLRYEDEAIPFDDPTSLLKNFKLLNSKRKSVLHFTDKNSKIDSGKADSFYGSIAFNSSLKNGPYFLIYEDKNVSREIPIYVFANFQTQVFLNVKASPIFGSLKISITSAGFDGNNAQNQQLDALILKMFNGILVFPKDVKHLAKNGAWENVMLAFLGLYVYLLSSKEKDISFYQQYIQQLEILLEKDIDAPEFRAIRLLASVVFKSKKPMKTLIYPTMIAKGMQVFLQQSIENERLIGKNSMVQKILDNLKTDSIWTSYEVLPEEIKKTNRPTHLTANSRNPSAGFRIDSMRPSINNLKISPSSSKEMEDPNWITENILHELNNPRIKHLKTKDLAIQLQVTQNSIRQSLNFLKNETALVKLKKSKKGFEKIDIDMILKRIQKIK